MISYRDNLKKIGIAPDATTKYSDFASKPQSLREAIQSMDAPPSQQWQQVSNIFRDDFWTDEVQGVAWNGTHWIFSTNANQAKPGSEDKALYVFKGGRSLGDGEWVTKIKFKDVPHPIKANESDEHWGQLTYHNGSIYVAQYWEEGPKKGRASVVKFKSNGANLTFQKWIELEQPVSPTDGTQAKAEFQGINPWDGMFYTCFGGTTTTVHEFFLHDPESGNFTGKSLKLDVPVTKVQGACFSANGHLYIASNATLPGKGDFQTIWYYSALNGHRFGVIPVLAEEGYPHQELEGICFADIKTSGGRRAQIHAVLLENRLPPALDNIFFKSFSADQPANV